MADIEPAAMPEVRRLHGYWERRVTHRPSPPEDWMADKLLLDALGLGVVQQTLRQLKAQMPAAPPAEQQLHAGLTRFMRDLFGLFAGPCFSDLHLALVRHGNDRPDLRSAFARELLDPLNASLASYLGARRARDFHRDPQRSAREIVAIMLGLAETSRLLGRTDEEAIRQALPLIAALAEALARTQQNQLCRVA